MGRISRRDFLKLGVLGLGGILLSRVLSACGLSQPASTSPVASQTPPVDNAGIESTGIPVASAGTPASFPDVVVARGGEPEALVRSAVAALGGMGRFVAPGAKVLVKPNICVSSRSYEYAATTNPWVVGTLVRLCLEAGAASVSVFDFPFAGSAQDAYVKSGIQEQVEAAGGKMILPRPFQYLETSIPAGVDLKSTSVFDEVLNTDVLINVPIAKQHGSSRLTLAMKNLMGVILDRNTLHINLGQRIADLATLVRPALNIIDAVRILTSGGPTGGDLAAVQKLDTIIASTDIVAADSYAASLFGLQPEDLAYIRAGQELGLGRSDLQNLNIQEITGR
jgi:uncharacterized protein (DUF362 family)